MRISRDQYEAAYRVGLEFHERKGELGIVEAKSRLMPTDLNSNSAADLIYGVDHLLRGVCYKRALSVETTDDFLTWILRDRGEAKLVMALQALQLHIDYRQERNSADKCWGLQRLLVKYQPMHQVVKESSLVLEWTDAEVNGVMDWLPLSWFAEEGSFLREHHPVGTKNRRQGEAYCDVTVTSLTAKLDYLNYPGENGPNEIIPGVVRLTFSDEDRTKITVLEWSTDGKSFTPAEFRLLEPVVPSARTDYTPPSKAAGKTEHLVRERPGQAKFRRELRLVYKHRCCLTGCTVTEALEGAHIDPYQSTESDHIQNGLLLRSDIHKLFDSHLIGIDPTNHTVYVAKRVRETTDYQSLHGAEINLPTNPSHHPDRAALERHWKKI